MFKNFIKKSLLTAVVLLMAVSALTACSSDDGGFNDTRQINVISREDGSGTRGAFIEILGISVTDADGNTRDMTYDNAEIANGTSIVMGSVSGNDYAIGYISMGSLNDSVRALNINNVAATPENVINGSYILFRTFYMTVQNDVSDLTQDFIDFVLSAEGQEIAGRNYIAAIPSAPAYIPGENLSGTIVVAGSTSVSPLFERLKEAYEAIHTNVTVEVQVMGSTAGINASISGLADIGLSSRDLRPSELEEIHAISVAYDGLAVIVNNNNPLANLTPEQVRQVFVGDIRRWDGF